MNFSEFRIWFDNNFSKLLEQKIHLFSSLSKNTDVPDIISYVLKIAQNGKRFRPFLIYSASGLDHKDCEKHFLLFASVELLHVFALIHDDIMDEADSRHGVICAHRKFIEKYGESTSEAIGILLGDVVFAWAYECLYDYTLSFPHIRDRIIEEFTKLVSEVTHGQILDVLSPSQSSLDEKAIIEKMTLKTARYSFVQPLRFGFVVRGDNFADQSFAESFGIPLGIGFQLQDDLLDGAPTNQTGKTRYIDIQSRQQTLISWYMQHKAKSKDKEKFLTFFGKKDMNEKEQGQIFELFESSGVHKYIKDQSDLYFNVASEAINTYRTSDNEQWKNIIALVQGRKK
jgi:geranylgeranyl pyrophosphate synthase